MAAHYLALVAQQAPAPPTTLQGDMSTEEKAIGAAAIVSIGAVALGTFFYGRDQGRGILPSALAAAVAGVSTEAAWVAGLTFAAYRGAVPGIVAASVPLAVGVGVPLALLKK